MTITTRTSGSDVIVEADGKKIAAFDYVEVPHRYAVMKAEAFADGLRRGLELAQNRAG